MPAIMMSVGEKRVCGVCWSCTSRFVVVIELQAIVTPHADVFCSDQACSVPQLAGAREREMTFSTTAGFNVTTIDVTAGEYHSTQANLTFGMGLGVVSHGLFSRGKAMGCGDRDGRVTLQVSDD